MERNIVTGNGKDGRGEAENRRQVEPVFFSSGHFFFAPSPRRPISPSSPSQLSKSRQCGFTLLELMIVISIIIILAAIALPQYQKTILHTREAVLRDDLFKMRSLLDQYAADKNKLPQSLDDLITGGYMRELPQDPFTGQKDWVVTSGDDPNSTSGEQGVTDIHSASGDISSEGTPYSEW
jgi:general secretion pathway protein G